MFKKDIHKEAGEFALLLPPQQKPNICRPLPVVYCRMYTEVFGYQGNWRRLNLLKTLPRRKSVEWEVTNSLLCISIFIT